MSLAHRSRPRHRQRRRRAAALGVLATAALVLAQPATVLAQTPPLEGVGTGVEAFGGWDWVNLALRLGLVVAVIWAAIYGLRWYGRRVTGVAATGRALQVLETRALGPNRSLQLVRVGRRAVLVGVTPERINHLLELDDPEEVERIAQSLEAERASGPNIARVAGTLSRLMTAPRQLAAARARAAGGALPDERSEGEGATADWQALQGPDASQASRLQASAAYRRARIEELQRAIEAARAGTSFERMR